MYLQLRVMHSIMYIVNKQGLIALNYLALIIGNIYKQGPKCIIGVKCIFI